MECFRELIIGPPPIVMKPSLPIRAQYRGGLLKSAARKNVINRDLRAQAYPKPLEISGDSPTRLIHPVDLASPQHFDSVGSRTAISSFTRSGTGRLACLP